MSGLDVKCVMVESTNWWQGGVGEEEVQFIKPCPPRVKHSAETAEFSQFFSSGGCWRDGENLQTHRRGKRNISQPRLLPRGVKLWWRRNSEAVPKATLCVFTAAEEGWGYSKHASTPARWELAFFLEGLWLSPQQGGLIWHLVAAIPLPKAPIMSP